MDVTYFCGDWRRPAVCIPAVDTRGRTEVNRSGSFEAAKFKIWAVTPRRTCLLIKHVFRQTREEMSANVFDYFSP